MMVLAIRSVLPAFPFVPHLISLCGGMTQNRLAPCSSANLPLDAAVTPYIMQSDVEGQLGSLKVAMHMRQTVVKVICIDFFVAIAKKLE